MWKNCQILFLLCLFTLPALAMRDASVNISWIEIKVADSIAGDSVSFRMRRVDNGSFVMGATPEQRSDDDAIDHPSHYVSMSAYYIGETEVTQQLWRAVMHYLPSPEGVANLNAPVSWITWKDAVLFTERLSEITGYSFHLPTEAQWEYAARGGQKAQEVRFAGSNRAEDVGWVYSNSGNRAHEIKGKKANVLGLYDMTGNVSEWCSDWIGPYRLGEQPDPTGPETDSVGLPVGLNDYWSVEKVARGGSWDNSADNIHLSSRGHHPFEYAANDCGLRLAMTDPFSVQEDNTLPKVKNLKVGKKKLKFRLVDAEKPFYIAEDALTNAEWVAVLGKYNSENIEANKAAVTGVSRSRQEVFCEKVSRQNSYSDFLAGGSVMILSVASDEDMRIAEHAGVSLHIPKSAPKTDRQGSAYSRERRQAKNISVLAELVGVRVQVPEDKVLETLIEDKRNTTPLYLVLK